MIFVPHCSPGLFRLKFHQLHYPVDYLEKFLSLSFMDVGHLEFCNVVTKNNLQVEVWAIFDENA